MIRMKAFYITGPQQYEFRDIPMPKLQTPTDVLVKVKAAGICGSDIHSFNGDNINFEFGRIPGHEITAEVVEVGPAVTTLRPGDRVVHEIMRSCGKCYACPERRTSPAAAVIAAGAATLQKPLGITEPGDIVSHGQCSAMVFCGISK